MTHTHAIWTLLFKTRKLLENLSCKSQWALWVLIAEMKQRAYVLSWLTKSAHEARAQIAELSPVTSTSQHQKSAGLPRSTRRLIVLIRAVPMASPGF